MTIEDFELTFDKQSEGTRSGSLYELIQCYPDKEPFFEAIIRQFSQNLTSDDGFDFNHCCELLELFAADGRIKEYQVIKIFIDSCIM